MGLMSLSYLIKFINITYPPNLITVFEKEKDIFSWSSFN